MATISIQAKMTCRKTMSNGKKEASVRILMKPANARADVSDHRTITQVQVQLYRNTPTHKQTNTSKVPEPHVSDNFSSNVMKLNKAANSHATINRSRQKIYRSVQDRYSNLWPYTFKTRTLQFPKNIQTAIQHRNTCTPLLSYNTRRMGQNS